MKNNGSTVSLFLGLDLTPLKKTWFGATLVAMVVTVNLRAQTPGPKEEMDTFVSDLLGRMTLEEKIGQLNLLSAGFEATGPVVSKGAEASVRRGAAGGVFNLYMPGRVRQLQDVAVHETRLHIPLLFGYDVIHGHKTTFPIPLALSCTWNADLIERSARIAATEASADGVNWTFSPMVDIARDPRWGRIAEGAGEDPFLGSVVAQAMVRGYQGSNLADIHSIMACAKHFALYGAAEAGRDYNTADLSRLTMFQYYLPPYKAAVDAGVGSVMTSFNEIEGIPATGNHWLVSELLRQQWGFKGLVVSDYTAVTEMSEHGMGSAKDDAELAINAGVDMDMVSEAYLKYVKQLVAEKKVAEATLDASCRRVLEAKYKLGLFSDPYRGASEERAQREILTPEDRQFAREAAARSFVLLKNDEGVLPMKREQTIALIGPLADSRRDVLGSWSAAGNWKTAVSVLDGLKQAMGSSGTLLQSRGANLVDDPELLATLNASGADIVQDKKSPREMIEDAVAIARKADVVVAVLGESFAMSGEAASRSELGLPEGQQNLLKALVETGKPVVLVLMNGRPLTLAWEAAHCAAILETWFGGLETGNAVADVLFGDYNPSGRLTASFPRNVGQIPIYYNHKNTGRPYKGNPRAKYVSRYLDIPNTPQYPFGYGLAYTTFAYGPVRLSRQALTGDESLTASIVVTNTGGRAGEETVQLYITQPVASLTRSVLELHGFQKVRLEPGQSREVSFTVTTDDLKFYRADGTATWEPGDFIIRIGHDSSDLKSATVHWSKPAG